MNRFADDVKATRDWFANPRFENILRLYTADQVVEQRGTIPVDYIIARDAATAFYDRLQELFSQGKSITTFGPYTPGQAAAIKRIGIEGIYLGGWATSAKGSITSSRNRMKDSRTSFSVIWIGRPPESATMLMPNGIKP